MPAIPLQLPVIPLGVDCDSYAKTPGFISAARQKWRQGLGIKSDDVAVLFVGRLSFHAKAHPLALYRALEDAGKQTGKNIHLIMSGWFANDAIKNSFVDAARVFCPSVRVTFVDGRKKDVRESIWYAADIFSSLSDNVQETFGLTPLEAMAAGLPVVISNWDGYKETARHEESGFLIPTWAPPAGTSEDIAIEHANGLMNYDNYIGYQSQFCNVDIQACTNAFVALIESPELRRRMGEAGQKRARLNFDWPVIVLRYEELWQGLAELRKSGMAYDDRKSSTVSMPARQDPTILFQDYPSNVVSDETILVATLIPDKANFEKVCSVSMNTFAASRVVLISEAERILLIVTESKSIKLGDLKRNLPSGRHKAIMLTVLWLSKMGLLQLQ